jgi:hypothetical protein
MTVNPAADAHTAAPITGPDGIDGDLLACGYTNQVVTGEHGIRVFAGVVNDPFAGDAAALEAFKAAFAQGSSPRAATAAQ